MYGLSKLTTKEKWEDYLRWYQTSYEFHPYTCGGCGEVLTSIVITDKGKMRFYMKCHKCNYTQSISFEKVKEIAELYLSRR